MSEPSFATATNCKPPDGLVPFRKMKPDGLATPPSGGTKISVVISTPARTSGPYMKATVALCHACLSFNGAAVIAIGKDNSIVSASCHSPEGGLAKVRYEPATIGPSCTSLPLIVTVPLPDIHEGTRTRKAKVARLPRALSATCIVIVDVACGLPGFPTGKWPTCSIVMPGRAGQSAVADS